MQQKRDLCCSCQMSSESIYYMIPSLILISLCQGDATRSDTDEDKVSTNLDEDLEKLKDLRATGDEINIVVPREGVGCGTKNEDFNLGYLK